MLQRLRGKQVKLITGTDEHGEKIALAAAANGVEPQQHCDDTAELYKSLWRLVSAAHIGAYSAQGQACSKCLHGTAKIFHWAIQGSAEDARWCPCPLACLTLSQFVAAGHPVRLLRAHHK